MRKLSKILALVLVLMTVFSVITAITASAAAGQVWTVAGSSGLCGSNWSTTDTKNDMTYDEATDSYVKVYYNVKAGTYEFKCAKNHAWGTAYPGSNKKFTVAKDGSTVTITLKGTAVSVKVEAPACDHAYEVTGGTVTCLTAGTRTWTCSKCQNSYTEDLEALGHYYDESGKCIRCDATAELVRVYVENAAKWANVYCYTWDTNPYVAWPGEQMKLDSESGLYYYDIPKHFVNVIFNNGDGTQSADLKTPTGTATIYNNSTKKWTAPHVCSFVDGKCSCGEVDPSFTVVGTLDELKAALLNGGNILLNADITSSEIIVIGQPTVLVGGGHTITSTAARAINISGANGVTIKNLTVVASGERAFNVIQNATNVVIENVTATAANYTVNVASSAANAVVTVKNSDLTGLNVVNLACPGVQVTLLNTKLTCNDQTDVEAYSAISLGKESVDGKVTATGVEFVIHGDSLKAKNSASAEGGEIVFTDAEVEVSNTVACIIYGDYYYSFATLEKAIAKAKSGETIVLLADVNVEEALVVPYTVKVDLNGHVITGDVTFELPPFPEVVVTPIVNPDLTFALNFGIKDVETFTPEYVAKLLEVYGDMYVDYRLTIEGLTTDTEVVFNANGNADGYLGGQYDAWSPNWVYVPFEDATIANGGSLMIMETAAEMMGKSGLRYTLAEVVTIVVDFDCGVFFTEEFLLANPYMKVTLDLIVFEEDAEGNKTLLNGAPVATNVFYGHEHTYETVVTAPTCDDAGYTTYTCACGDTYTGDEVAALGHDLVDVEALAATCTTAGYTAHKDCSRCDYIEGKEVIDALGHKDTRLDAKCDVCGQYFLPTSPFKLEMYQASKKQTYYFTGAMSGYYFATSTDITKAVDLYAEEVEGGYNVYFMNGSTKNYLYIQLSGTHINAKFGTTKAVWYVDPTYGALVTEISGTKYFLGTYSNYVTFGGTAYSRLTASTADVSQYVGRAVSLENHVCAEFTSKVTAPTCTAQGYTTKTCVDCGAVTKVDYVDALGHDLVDVEAKDPTCTEAGYTAHKDCSRCTYVEGKETVAALGHTEVIDEAVAPTCTETGLTEGKHCSVCEEVLVAQKEVPALGHTFGEVTVTTEPTCTVAGEGTHTCSVCGVTETVEVAALGHVEVLDKEVAPTCTEAGLTKGSHCSVCNEVLAEQKEVPALGHTFVDGECECGAKDPSIVPPVVEPEVEEEEDLNAFEKIWAFILGILNWVVDFFKGAFVKA